MLKGGRQAAGVIAVVLAVTCATACLPLCAFSQEGWTAVRNGSPQSFSQFRSACERGDIDALSRLIGSGLDVNAVDHSGQTLLMYAIENVEEGAFCTDVVRLLVAKGADVNRNDSSGRAPLVRALEKNNRPVAELLLENGADVTANTPYAVPLAFLPFVLQKPDMAYPVVRKLENVNIRDQLGNTPLSWAARLGWRDCAARLISKGADINNRSIYGKTPLMEASEKGHDGSAALLIRSGADVNAQTKKGWSALMWASEKGYTPIVAALIDAGADLFAKNGNGERALLVARKNNQAEAAGAIENAEREYRFKRVLAFGVLVLAIVLISLFTAIFIVRRRRRGKTVRERIVNRP